HGRGPGRAGRRLRPLGGAGRLSLAAGPVPAAAEGRAMAGRAGMRWRRLAWLAAPAAAGAKVLDAAPAGFTVADTRSVPVPPERAWQAPVAEADRAMAQQLGGLADYLGRPWPRARLSA